MVEPEFDEFAGMDPEARAKAARKREAVDRKKVEKKAQENKRKRAAAQAEKEQERARKKAYANHWPTQTSSLTRTFFLELTVQEFMQAEC